MGHDERDFDAFLAAVREGNEDTARRLLDACGDDRLRRLAALRERARVAAPPDGVEVEPGLPFERLGEYRLLRRLGEGGMGQLFVAQQESLGRMVALKLIQTTLLGSATARERFRREAMAAARLQHPSLVTIHASGEEHGVAYIAMEYVRGHGLDALLKASRSGAPLDARRVIRWGARLARALAYAHDRGVLHRDVKPSNILVTPDDEPVLIDFGVARDARWSGQTVTRDFAGSLPYAAPEQLAGRADRIDGRVDVYALAATLYEALTGRLPIAGRSLENLLAAEPTPPRRWNPELPRDLEVVLLKALDKQPSRRYADAAAFAEDLEAILALRPIAARPPGRIERVRRWARRRPGAAAVLASTAAALALFGGYLVERERVQVREARAEATRLVASATSRLADYRRGRAELSSLEGRVAELERTLHARFLEPEEDRLLEQGQSRIAAARRDREAMYHEALGQLRNAELLDPGVTGDAERLRTDLYMQRWRDAYAVKDTEAAAFFRELVLTHDRDGRHTAELLGSISLTLTTDPPDAVAYLFRLVEQAALVSEGEHRDVPVPWGDDVPPPRPPGTFALRVVRPVEGFAAEDLVLELAGEPLRDAVFALRDHGPVRRGDRILRLDDRAVVHPLDAAPGDDAPHGLVLRRAGEEIDVRADVPVGLFGTPVALGEGGDVPALVYRRGGTGAAVLPAGLGLRPTAAPLFLSERCRVAVGGEIELPSGRWLVLVRHPGREDMRFAFHDDGTRWRAHVSLPTAPRPGFVPVFNWGAGDFWISEHETTAAEYLAFLNDPESQAAIEASPRPVLYPRDQGEEGVESYWKRDPDGRFRLEGEWLPDVPVVGVSYGDAEAYAAWLTRRAQREGRGERYALPRYGEWIRIGNSHALTHYPFGNHWRPKWVNSCYSRAVATLEPVLGYPIDESPVGVYDLSGGAAEWIDDWYDEEKRLRRAGGGAWGYARPEQFTLYGRGLRPELTSGVVGFRVVLREEP